VLSRSYDANERAASITRDCRQQRGMSGLSRPAYDFRTFTSLATNVAVCYTFSRFSCRSLQRPPPSPRVPAAMTPDRADLLSRRERQLRDVLYRLEAATVAEVMEALPDAPSYSTVRALLGRLVTKGVARYSVDGPRYVYSPARPVTRERVSAISHVVNTFFGGSRADAVAALFDRQSGTMSDEELERLTALVEDAKRRGR
jgi:BlaI family transcriptional regulator, penicillinase repressor